MQAATTTRRADRWWLLGLLAVALVVRLGYHQERRQALDFERPIVDAEWHHWWAGAWATGDWSPPHGVEAPEFEGRAYLRPPGYPAFLALVYRVFGVSVDAAVLLQFALGLLRVLLVHRIARAMGGPVAARVAAALVALGWTFVYFEGELQSPALLDALVLGAWALAIEGRVGLRRAAAVGLLGGLALVVRPDALALVAGAAVLAGWRAPASRFGRTTLVLLAALALALAPSTLRNAAESGRFVPVSANLGLNLYLGNHTGADGTCGAVLPGYGRFATCWDWPAVLRRIGSPEQPASDAEAGAELVAATGSDIAEDPLGWLGLLLRKARLYWGWREIGHNKELALDRERSAWLWLPTPMPLLAVLGGLAVVAAWRRRAEAGFRALLLAAASVLLSFAVLLLFFVSARHRAPVMPLLSALAGCGVAGLLATFRRDRAALGAPLMGCVLALAVISLPPAGSPPDRAKWHFRHGRLWAERGEMEAAEREFAAALAQDPGHGPSMIEQALRLLDQRRPEARELALRAAQAMPEEPLARYAAGMALFYSGELEAARAELEAAARLGRVARVEQSLGMLHLARRDLAEAERRFRSAAELDPGSTDAWTGLGLVHYARGEDGPAEGHLRHSLELDPAQGRARFTLGLVLERRGRIDAALEQYREAEGLGQPGAAEARRRLQQR